MSTAVCEFWEPLYKCPTLTLLSLKVNRLVATQVSSQSTYAQSHRQVNWLDSYRKLAPTAVPVVPSRRFSCYFPNLCQRGVGCGARLYLRFGGGPGENEVMSHHHRGGSRPRLPTCCLPISWWCFAEAAQLTRTPSSTHFARSLTSNGLKYRAVRYDQILIATLSHLVSLKY